MTITRSTSLRALPAVALATFAFGIVATGCGDSNGDDKDNANAAAGQAEQPDQPAKADREAALALMPTLNKVYNRSDSKGFCAMLTRSGQREMAKYGADLKLQTLRTRNPTCEQVIQAFRTYVQGGGRWRPVRIKTLTIKGDKAKVTMKGGPAGIRSTADFKLVKENGEWKLVDPVSGTETRRVE